MMHLQQNVFDHTGSAIPMVGCCKIAAQCVAIVEVRIRRSPESYQIVNWSKGNPMPNDYGTHRGAADNLDT